MDKYMLLDAEPLTQADIDKAVRRAHTLRSVATWTFLSNSLGWLRSLTGSKAPAGSGLAHS